MDDQEIPEQPKVAPVAPQEPPKTCPLISSVFTVTEPGQENKVVMAICNGPICRMWDFGLFHHVPEGRIPLVFPGCGLTSRENRRLR